jgi:hypothetical protein
MRSAAEDLEELERLADLLDAQFTVPGTNVRFGLDSILGLIPAIGDAVGLFASLYIMTRLERLGVSRWTRVRMIGNVAVDSLVGVIPLLGDVFDVAFKANRKNIALARRALERAGKIPMTIDVRATEVKDRPKLR